MVLFSNPNVPRGQESFFNWIFRRYIGIQQKLVRNFVAKHTAIQMVQPLKNPVKGSRAIQSKTPFVSLSMDLADMITFDGGEKNKKNIKHGFRYIFLACCNYSGWVFARRLETKSAKEVSRKFETLLNVIRKDFKGHPKVVVSDLGTEFHNKKMKWLLKYVLNAFFRYFI